MQLIHNISKTLLLILLLACSILLTFTQLTIEVTGRGFIKLNPSEFSTSVATESTTTSVETKSADTTAKTVWDSIRDGFELDHHPQLAPVQKEIRRLTSDPDKFYSILKAAGPYMYYIYKQTHARGLPMELALIPFIESEFNPNDRSNKGATGLWQLMPQTAKELGVKVRSGYDGRRNVVASTHAALAYFNDLGNNFNGNWYLAIAAYNCGEGCVKSAKRRMGTENFWKLPVPRETKYYVPRLLAVAEIIENPDKYGIELPPIDDQPFFKEVKLDKPVSLAKIATTSGVNIKTLTKLNPDSKTGTLPTAKNGVATVLMPVKSEEHKLQQIKPANVSATVASAKTVSKVSSSSSATKRAYHGKPARRTHVAASRARRSRVNYASVSEHAGRNKGMFPVCNAFICADYK